MEGGSSRETGPLPFVLLAVRTGVEQFPERGESR
jgi:hypothetical protein